MTTHPQLEPVYSADLGHVIVDDFLIPVLADATTYDRVTGDFSSAFLVAAARGLSPFFITTGRMRLVTNGRFTEADVQAIRNGMDPADALERSLYDEIVQMEGTIDEFERDHLKALAWLLRTGRLEIRVSLLRDENGLPLKATNPIGVQHTKVGIINYADGAKVAFIGGLNESMRAYRGNAESLTPFASWEGQHARIVGCERIFDNLWNDRSPATKVFPFPEAAKRKLIDTYPCDEPPGLVRATRMKTSLWRHQDEAIAAFLEKQAGILEMATGTGKTRTALRITRDLIEPRRVRGAVIATVGTDLLDQWYKAILEFFGHQRFLIYRHYAHHHQGGIFLRHKDARPPILIASYDQLAKVLEQGVPANASDCLLICDEVHNLGSAGRIDGLSDRIKGFRWRLGLSATPERAYDPTGNAFIERELGPVIFRFTLEDAIKRGILCEFDYSALRYELSDDDLARIQALYGRHSARLKAGELSPVEELYREIARVKKESHEKLAPFAAHLRTHPQILKRSIIFVETMAYGAEVQKLIHPYTKEYHTFYGEDDKKNLQLFADGELNTLITCKRISEGIDIKSVENIILFSSDRTKLVTTQRIGRCLRTDPENPAKRAHVLDFVIGSEIDHDDEEDDGEEPETELADPTADKERYEWLTALSATRREKHV